MKVVYFGFDLFYDCIEKIADCGNEIIGIFTCKVDGVFESSDRIYNYAVKNNIPITDKKPTKDDMIFLKENGCELIFSAGYYHKIPIIDGLDGVNIHPAVLPIGRGPWPQPVAILKSLSVTGVTLHKLSDSFDCGDIILQRCFLVSPKENLESLNDKYLKFASIIVTEFFGNVEYYLCNSKTQSAGEYWAEPSKDEMSFSLDDDYDTIDRITRAFYGFYCYLISEKEERIINKAKCVTSCESIGDHEDLFKINGGWLVVLNYT